MVDPPSFSCAARVSRGRVPAAGGPAGRALRSPGRGDGPWAWCRRSPYLSLTAVHRRGWGSLYAALAAGTLDVPALRDAGGRVTRWTTGSRSTRWTPASGRATTPRPARRGATTTPPSRQSAGQPIVAGWSYAWLAQVSFTHDSWTAPLDVRRVPPSDDAHAVAGGADPGAAGAPPGRRPRAAVRVRRRLRSRDARPGAGRPGWRAGRGAGAAAERALLLRRSAATRQRAGRGRPRRHGPKFACADRAHLVGADRGAPRGARPVRPRCGCAPGPACTPRRRTTRTGAVGAPGRRVRGTLVLVEVERLPRQTRIPKQLWLWWRGPGTPDLAVLWRAYVHRFDLEHTYRFCKQTLNWTTPRVRHPEQADRWTWLVLLAYTQLRLARRAIEDVRLPWERPQRPTRRALTPARVRQAFPQLLVDARHARRPRQNPAAARPAARSGRARAQRHATRPSRRPPELRTGPLPITKPADPLLDRPARSWVKSQA